MKINDRSLAEHPPRRKAARKTREIRRCGKFAREKDGPARRRKCPVVIFPYGGESYAYASRVFPREKPGKARRVRTQKGCLANDDLRGPLRRISLRGVVVRNKKKTDG